jgi:RHS repeat-associated protein
VQPFRPNRRAALPTASQKERDNESGNDYFLARYYSSALGRFTTPDWSAKTDPVPYAVFTDPQSLNLYAYVRNNPLTRIDADGHQEPVTDTTIVVGLAAYAVVGGLSAYYHTPAGERNMNTLVSATEAKFGSGVQKVKETVSNVLKSEKKPGTKGKPDHQQTVKEEAEKIGGKPEVPIATPGGHKEGRVGDAVAKDADGNVTAVTQVYRPTPAGNIPLREQKAAQDIKNATGVKPKMVPVRPLPQQ